MTDLFELIEEDAQPMDFHGLRFDHTHAGAVRQAVDANSMSADFIILTTKPNYHGNAHQIMESKLGKGMQTARHEQNPVVLLEHGFGGVQFPAIGLSKDKQGKYTVKKKKNQATATVFFSQSNPDAATVFAMVDEGVLHMASIGFDALKGMPMKQERPKELPEGVADLTWQCRGILFTETELVEWSIVSQGADPGAVKQYLDRGKVGTEKLTDRMTAYLQALAPKAAWSPGFREVEPITQSETKPPVIEPVPEYDVVISSESRESVEKAVKALHAQSALDTLPADNNLPSSLPEGQVGGGDKNGSPSPVPLPNLVEQFEQHERAKNHQHLQEALLGAVEGMIEKQMGELAAGQQRIEENLNRALGIIE